MKHIVSISGGVGSYFTLKRVLEKAPKEDVIAVFCDTLAEDGDLYRFLDDIEQKLDIQIVRLCEGKTPFELAWEDNFLYNSRIANCSRKLKSKPFRAWLKANYRPDECILYLGIDWTETHRKGAIERNYAPYRVEFPMCEPPYIDKPEMIEGLKEDNIEIPYLYRMGFSHNNCAGCCVKGGIGHWKLLLEKDRRSFLQWENKKREIRLKLGKDVSILKHKGKPYTLRELRESVEGQGVQLSMEELCDIGGCGCFVEED
jgi:3'-phosphoadenosine 5'-phosphosulfate sulfotransferase (PAPS reductase)/FAD synthetase